MTDDRHNDATDEVIDHWIREGRGIEPADVERAGNTRDRELLELLLAAESSATDVSEGEAALSLVAVLGRARRTMRPWLPWVAAASVLLALVGVGSVSRRMELSSRTEHRSVVREVRFESRHGNKLVLFEMTVYRDQKQN